MSLYCPKCWAKAKVVDSRCNPRTNHVRRRHECTDSECQHKFTTVELIVGSVDLREQASRSSLLDLAWELFEKLGGDQAEKQFFDEWLELQRDRQTKYAPKKSAPKVATQPSKAHPWRQSRGAANRVTGRPTESTRH